ncbi:MAG: tetratricopeptide repeat protein [Candidatus Omnitrophica bacterium]|nr:tetratricopeptide repeat protein [Candidatus Omnitrophota bacterium]
MNPEQERYILKQTGRKSAEATARDLGIKERKVKKFLERQESRGGRPAGPTGIPSRRRNIILCAALIALLGFAVYGNSINGEFIWDDTHLVKDNLYLRGWSNLPKFFSESMGAGADAATIYSFYRPLQLITYAIDYSFWKLDVRGYHLANIFYHVLAALMVFWLITALYKDWRLSLFAGLFFVAHPIHTEAVSYISGRADSLALIFMLLSFLLYIKILERESTVYYCLMTLSYLAAILSKELSLILPFLLLLYHYTFKQKIRFKAMLPILVLNVSYIIARLTVLRFLASHVVHKTTFAQRLAGLFIAMAGYVRILVLPFNLHMEYGNSFFRLTDPKVGLGIIVVVALFILIFKTRKTRNIAFFSLGWFLIGLFPVSNLIPINAYMAEHWLYVPSIGIFLLLARGLALLYQEKKLKALSVTAVVLFLGFYSYLTVNQNSYWKAPIPFYLRTLKYANKSSRVYYNLANQYRESGQNEQAVPLYQEALKIRPDYMDAYYNLGKAYGDMGKTGDAEKAYQNVIKNDPKYFSAYYNLGNLYYAAGRYNEAVDAYKTVIRINPKHIKAHNNLGVAYAGLGQKEEAEGLFKKAIAVDSKDAMAYGNLAILYFGQQKYDLAVEYYEKAVRLGFVDPKFLGKIAPYRTKTP